MLLLNGNKLAFEPWHLLKRGDVVLIYPFDERMRAAFLRRARLVCPGVRSETSAGRLRIYWPEPKIRAPFVPKRPYVRKTHAQKRAARRKAERREWHRLNPSL